MIRTVPPGALRVIISWHVITSLSFTTAKLLIQMLNPKKFHWEIIRPNLAPGNWFCNQAEFEHSKSAGAQRGKESGLNKKS